MISGGILEERECTLFLSVLPLVEMKSINEDLPS